MRRIKIIMDQKNYFSIASRHIFINFTKANLDFIKTLSPKSLKKIHIFITNHASINHHLLELINMHGMVRGCKDKSNQRNPFSRIIVHLSKGVSDLIPLFKDFLKNFLDRVTYFVDEKNVKFSDSKSSVIIEYRMNTLRVLFKGNDVALKFPEYPYNATPIDEREEGIFKTAEERLNPLLFKDKLIAAFKNKAPAGILKSFKSDNDIWDFIMKQGEWSIKEEVK